MDSLWSKLLVFLLCFLLPLTLINPVSAENNFLCACLGSETYQNDSLYEKNLDTLLSSLAPNLDKYGFYNTSVGQTFDDTINAIVLCRGDVKPDICRSCVNDSAVKIKRICPNHKAAMGGYDQCMLRYRSPYNITKEMERPSVYADNPTHNVTSADRYNEVLRELLGQLRSQAAKGGSDLKFATGSQQGPENQIIYGMAQCTPDLSEKQCTDCVDEAICELPGCCNNRIGGRVLKSYLQYSMFNSCLLKMRELSCGAESSPPTESAVSPSSNTVPPPSSCSRRRINMGFSTVYCTILMGILLCALFTHHWRL